MAKINPISVDIRDVITNIPVKVVKTHSDAQLPQYAHLGDAGADVRSVHKYVIPPGDTVAVELGLRMEIPNGWEIQVRSRSGLSKKGLVVANAPGTIDAPYRGPVMVLLHNQSRVCQVVEPGDRIAQFVLKRAPRADFRQVEELGNSERGEGGFGSTGVK